MTDRKFTIFLMLLAGIFLAPLVNAQNETPPAEQDEAEPVKTNPESQEVEYNDDNYRRFMELKDRTGQRSTLPTNTFQSGTQKLDKLPESSQKHLRNQLREIILTEGEWAPGDENKEYPYVASEAAENSPALQQQEAEAWGELVGKYHEREGQIYASRTGQKDGAQAQANTGGPGKQATGEASDGENSGAGEAGDSKDQNVGQEHQTASAANEGTSSSASSSAAANPNDPESISTSGVSQSALEYLMGSSNGNQASEGSPAQQAANTDKDNSQFIVISKNTLSIKDLQNAQGISISSGKTPVQNPPLNSDD
jgi:hypothetical protein